MSMFTRNQRPTGAPKSAAVVSYSNPSATVEVREGAGAWELSVRAKSGVQGVFTFTDRRAAVGAAEWLAYQNLTGIGSAVGPGMTWVEFVDAINDKRGTVVTPDLADALPELSPAVLERVLEVHYAQVLASKEGRRMWSKLLRDAATVERAEQIRRGAV